ncbi:hypothetical protein [Senegalia massiliensis]|uniref:Uncharacterized protein n=1 Tax=Senegalia massiliensis TaxID=1720316 RepID=A0A845QZU2_9CLOT|nr:hypothetical protein [Senegalia massiliensis]NBI06702.1 hypothetical protein [Senegalia massiliensis]
MRNNGIIKFLIIYFIAKLIGVTTGLSYNVLTQDFNLIKLILDIIIWVIAYFIVDLVFSKSFKKQTK